jgi:hypothetical protein
MYYFNIISIGFSPKHEQRHLQGKSTTENNRMGVEKRYLFNNRKSLEFSYNLYPHELRHYCPSVICTTFALPLCLLFNRSLASCSFPDRWKFSFVTSTFKSRKRNDVELSWYCNIVDGR